MAGGDLHVRVGASYGAGGIHKVVDANSNPSADLGLTEGMTIEGRTVYVRPEAKQQLEAYTQPALGTSMKLTVHDDAKTSRNFPDFWNKTKSNNLPERGDARGQVWSEDFLGSK